MSGPLYRKIADQLRDEIVSGQLEPGSTLPTEPELEQRFGVSRTTVRHAVRELTNEGLVATATRRGTYVRSRTVLDHHAVIAEDPDRPMGAGESDSFVGEVTQAGRKPSTDFEMRIEVVPPEVSRRLGLPPDSLVCIRDVRRFVDDEPWSQQTSYYPMDIAEVVGLTKPHDIPQGTVRALAAAGYREVGHIDELTARMPSPDEAQAFDMGPGTPLVLYVRTACTAERAIRLTKTALPADRNRVLYELGDYTFLNKVTEANSHDGHDGATS